MNDQKINVDMNDLNTDASDTLSVEAVISDPVELEPLFGSVPDHIKLPIDIESGVLVDYEKRHPYLVIEKSGFYPNSLPKKTSHISVENGWEIMQLGKEILAMSAGEASWVDYASTEASLGQIQPVIIDKKEQVLPYFVMKGQPCQVQSLLGEGSTLSIPSLDWSFHFEGSSLSPEWTPSKSGTHEILDDKGKKIGDMRVCEPKTLPPKQGTVQAQADKTIDVMVAKAHELGWEEIRVRCGDVRSLFSLWVAGKQQCVPVNNEDVNYSPYYDKKLEIIAAQIADDQTSLKKTKR